MNSFSVPSTCSAYGGAHVWSEIEAATERLVEPLDSGNASAVDLEPNAETCVGDGLPGDMTDAEAERPIARFRVGHRLRR